MNVLYPPKLKHGDEIRVIAPSRSLSIIAESVTEIADRRFAQLGMKLSFGRYVNECDEFGSSPIDSRLDDFHDAFRNPEVKAILTVIGGYNSNQLLRYLDWDLIKNNPKIFCGFSDITALHNAIFAKTGLVTYSGPHYSTFWQELYFDYTLEYFMKCLFDDKSVVVNPSLKWSDDKWFRDQQNRRLIDNDGYWIFNGGRAEGRIIGGNLCTLNLLQGTQYFPGLADSVLFIEDDDESQAHTFDRDLQSLTHLPDFEKVRGIVIGRFQKSSNVMRETLTKIIKTKRELDTLPVIGNADFGHTDPKITFPVGGLVSLGASEGSVKLVIKKH